MLHFFALLADVSPKTEEITREALEKTSGTPLTTDDLFVQQFFYMLTILGLLIGAMLAASWVIKRISTNRVEKLNSESDVKILDERSLSPRTQLYVVEVEGKRHLIAESMGGNVTISPLTSES